MGPEPIISTLLIERSRGILEKLKKIKNKKGMSGYKNRAQRPRRKSMKIKLFFAGQKK
jgi:hypothetical protein